MSEESQMTEENKKTIIAFVAGLLVGGLLVFIFSEPTPQAVMEEVDDSVSTEEDIVLDDALEEEENDETERVNRTTNSQTDTEATQASVSVADQKAGDRVYLQEASYPTEQGWVGVREYENGRLTGLLGAARWSKAEGLEPDSVGLLRPTVSGNTYAVVFFSENGDQVFSLATDSQMSTVMETFEAE